MTTEKDILAAALDIRRGMRQFIEVPAADRPAVAAMLSTLSDAKMQELLGSRAARTGFGSTERSRVG